MRKGFKNICVREKDHEMLTYIARTLGMSKAQTIHDVTIALFELVSLFKSANLSYQVSVLEKSLTIEADGKMSLRIGEFSVKPKKVKK